MPDHASHPHRVTFNAWLRALESGASGDEIAAFFTPDVVAVELPNALFPAGNVRDLQALRAAADRGQRAVSAQRYEVRRVLVEGEHLAAQIEWSATLKMSFAAFEAGSVIRASIACFLRFRDGLIAENHSYDCYALPASPASSASPASPESSVSRSDESTD